MSPGRAYLAQQKQMDADFDAAMAADQTASPQYANAQEQMEAELEAAMAADLAAGGDGVATNQQGDDQWQQLQGEAERAADNVLSGESSAI